MICPCELQFAMPGNVSRLQTIVPKIANDTWYQNILPHLSLRTITPPVVLPNYWDDMMRLVTPNDYPSMVRYQESHVYNNMFEVRATPFSCVGQGVYVRNGVQVLAGTLLYFWGAIGHRSNQCLKSFDEGRQIELKTGHYPTRFIIHPGCLAGFVNDSKSPLSRKPNCVLRFNPQNSLDYYNPHTAIFLYINRTVYGDGTERAQLLFRYDP